MVSILTEKRLNCLWYKCEFATISLVNEVINIGVNFCSDIKFRSHCVNIRKEAQVLCALIFRSFTCRNTHFLQDLFVMYVRPYLDYASISVVTSP